MQEAFVQGVFTRNRLLSQCLYRVDALYEKVCMDGRSVSMAVFMEYDLPLELISVSNLSRFCSVHQFNVLFSRNLFC